MEVECVRYGIWRHTYIHTYLYRYAYMHPGMIKEAMNRTTNLFVLLILISFILPGSAIRYAQAATENSQDSDSTGNEQQQNSSSTGSGQESGSSNTGSGQESNNAGNEQQQSSSSTENSQQSNNAGNAQEMPGATSPSGSTANATSPSGSTANATSPSGSTANATSSSGPTANATSSSGPTANATSSSGPTANATSSNFTASASNSTGNMSSADFVKDMLAEHNRERAAVGVPPLVWSDKLAADAKPWAEHVVTEGHMFHDTKLLSTLGEGENIAGYGNPFNPKVGPLTQGGGAPSWVDEKKDYQVGQPSHYTQMVWRDTKEVGCATAYGRGIPYSSTNLGHVASKPNEFMSILVCRYSPPGNYPGQKAY
jgi:uncharacterized protein YkwD